jgi:hypothetical protein
MYRETVKYLVDIQAYVTCSDGDALSAVQAMSDIVDGNTVIPQKRYNNRPHNHPSIYPVVAAPVLISNDLSLCHI